MTPSQLPIMWMVAPMPCAGRYLDDQDFWGPCEDYSAARYLVTNPAAQIAPYCKKHAAVFLTTENVGQGRVHVVEIIPVDSDGPRRVFRKGQVFCHCVFQHEHGPVGGGMGNPAIGWTVYFSGISTRPAQPLLFPSLRAAQAWAEERFDLDGWYEPSINPWRQCYARPARGVTASEPHWLDHRTCTRTRRPRRTHRPAGRVGEDN